MKMNKEGSCKRCNFYRVFIPKNWFQTTRPPLSMSPKLKLITDLGNKVQYVTLEIQKNVPVAEVPGEHKVNGVPCPYPLPVRPIDFMASSVAHFELRGT